MSLSDVRPTPTWRRVGFWVVKGIVAAVFLAAGGAKLAGVPMLVQQFEHIGLGQWFRHLTGALEVAGAVTILIPSVAGFGAALLSCIMVGAVVTHLFVIGGTAVPAIMLLVLSATIAWAHRGQIDAFVGALVGNEA